MSVRPSYRPCLEPLETRELPAGLSAYVTGGNLYVVSAAGSNFIMVTEANQQLSVLGTQIALAKGHANNVAASSIGQIVVYGNGGNDFIDLAGVKTNAIVYAGNGDDYITCGSGNDIVNPGTGFDEIFHPYNPAQPFAGGESAGQIVQGQNPLCQTDAALAALAQDGFNFASNIQYLGGDTYLVKLYGLPAQHVFFDGWTDNNDPVEPASGAFWMVLMQRARLQALGVNPAQAYTQAQWDAINSKDGGQLYSIADAMHAFTGNIAYYTSMSMAGSPQALQAELAAGDIVIAQSPTGASAANALGIILNHAYAVTQVYEQNGTWKVRLYNPWGTDGEPGVMIDSLDTTDPAANNGFITLTWQQFTSAANFLGFFVAKQ